jgi:hypothetical protein
MEVSDQKSNEPMASYKEKSFDQFCLLRLSHRNLSIIDLAAFLLAKDLDATLLTGGLAALRTGGCEWAVSSWCSLVVG